MDVHTQNGCIQRNPCLAAVRVRKESYQPHQTTVSKAMFQYFACSSSHMVCYISSLKCPPCILLSSILRDSLLRGVWSEMQGFHQMSVPTRASPTAAVTDEVDPSPQEKNTFFTLLPLQTQLRTHVLSPRRKRPTSKCQLSQDLSPLFPQWKMSDGWWFSALWIHKKWECTVWKILCPSLISGP